MIPHILVAGLALAGLGTRPAPALPSCGLPATSDCVRRFAAHPEERETARCFHEAGKDPRHRAEAVRTLEQLAERYPDRPWLGFYLGNLLWRDWEERTLLLYRQAAVRFAARGDALGEVLARSNLTRLLRVLDRKEEAAAEIQHALRIARAAKDPGVRAQGLLLEARELIDGERELSRAYRLLLDAEEQLPVDEARSLKDCRFELGNVASDLGHLAEARRRFRQVVAHAQESCDPYTEVSARASLVRLLREELSELPRPGGREEVEVAARQTLAAAETSGQREAASKMHAVLGLLTPYPHGQAHFERCLALADAPSDRSYCHSTLARYLTEVAPREAQAALAEAFSLAQAANDPWTTAYAWRERMRVAWQLGPKTRAVDDSMAALAALDTLRDLETSRTGRAERFTGWVHHYQWLTGRLLRSYLEHGDGGDLERAFEVQEGARARGLREALAEAAGRPETARSEQRAQVLAAISRIQRQLIDPALPEPRRRQERAELERLERRELELREEPGAEAPGPPPTLAELQASLRANEALLAFQIAPWEDMVGDFAGGSWVVVVTHGEVRALPLHRRLAGRTELRQAVDLFNGMLRRGDASEHRAAAALYRALLAEAVNGLPGTVDRLIVVPDDALHRLAFAALRAAPEEAPLIERYQISTVPSAALWLAWSARRAHPAPLRALVLADPSASTAGAAEDAGAASHRAALFLTPLRLGSLPYARREGRRARRHLGGDADLWLGEKATEAALKSLPGHRYGLFHFATHAATDETAPERSSIWLAPGGEQEDGALQSREIAELDFTDAVVVLSSCESAAGELLRGEGVLSLARAFFEARAATVVATLWPLRDDHGAALFDRFYSHLGKGESVAAALRSAQRDRQAAGAPAAAWAGVVVLGDGERVPRPGGRRGHGGILAVALLAVALAAVATHLIRRGLRTLYN